MEEKLQFLTDDEIKTLPKQEESIQFLTPEEEKGLKKSETGSMGKIIGTIAGGVIGSVGGPVGAIAGGGFGAAAGGMIDRALSGETGKSTEGEEAVSSIKDLGVGALQSLPIGASMKIGEILGKTGAGLAKTAAVQAGTQAVINPSSQHAARMLEEGEMRLPTATEVGVDAALGAGGEVLSAGMGKIMLGKKPPTLARGRILDTLTNQGKLPSTDIPEASLLGRGLDRLAESGYTGKYISNKGRVKHAENTIGAIVDSYSKRFGKSSDDASEKLFDTIKGLRQPENYGKIFQNIEPDAVVNANPIRDMIDKIGGVEELKKFYGGRKGAAELKTILEQAYNTGEITASQLETISPLFYKAAKKSAIPGEIKDTIKKGYMETLENIKDPQLGLSLRELRENADNIFKEVSNYVKTDPWVSKFMKSNFRGYNEKTLNGLFTKENLPALQELKDRLVMAGKEDVYDKLVYNYLQKNISKVIGLDERGQPLIKDMFLKNFMKKNEDVLNFIKDTKMPNGSTWDIDKAMNFLTEMTNTLSKSKENKFNEFMRIASKAGIPGVSFLTTGAVGLPYLLGHEALSALTAAGLNKKFMQKFLTRTAPSVVDTAADTLMKQGLKVGGAELGRDFFQ